MDTTSGYAVRAPAFPEGLRLDLGPPMINDYVGKLWLLVECPRVRCHCNSDEPGGHEGAVGETARAVLLDFLRQELQ